MSDNDKHENVHHSGAAMTPQEHRTGHFDDGEPITDSDINYGSLIFISITGSLLTVAIVFLLYGLYGSSERVELTAKKVGAANEVKWQQFEDLRETQLAQLGGSSRWTNAERGLVSIPMDEAMKETLVEEQAKQAGDLAAMNQSAMEAQAKTEALASAHESPSQETMTPNETSDSAHSDSGNAEGESVDEENPANAAAGTHAGGAEEGI